jgi:hypothetical protein
MLTEAEVLSYAFLQNYHADKSNAAIHCSEVRFSPLTFRLAELLDKSGRQVSERVVEVLRDRGRYKEDAGRVSDE